MQRFWSLPVLVNFILSRFSWVKGQTLFSLGSFEPSFLHGASDVCIAALNTDVSCPLTLAELYLDPDLSLDFTELEDLCQGTCLSSLKNLRDSVQKQCGSKATYEDPTDGSLWKVAYLMEEAIYYVDRTCLQKVNGQYCNTWFQSTTDATLCAECHKLVLWHNAQSPLSEDTSEERSIYASASSSCGYKEQPTNTYQSLLVSSPTATPSCSIKYTIKAGDTFLSVSKSQRVATHDLMTANRLGYRLDNFPSSGHLCIRNQCDVYVVKEGDTCRSIQLANDMSRATLRSWNPFINGYCDNISSYVNQTICKSNPLGDHKVLENKDSAGFSTPAAVPGNVAPDTNIKCGLFHNVTASDNCGTIGLKYSISLDDFVFLNPMVYPNCTNLWLWTSYCVAPVGDFVDYPGYTRDENEWTIDPQETTQVPMWDMFLGDGPYIPIANGTREDCRKYFWWNETLAGSPIDCLGAAQGYELDIEQFLLWNPSLDQNWTETDKYWSPGNYPCTISADVSYCMQLASPTPMPYRVFVPPSPRAAGEIPNCTRWFMAYFSCQTQLYNVRMSMQKMYRYNPSLKEDCSGYTMGTYYCYKTLDDLLYGYEDDPEPISSHSVPDTSKASSDTAQPTNTNTNGI